MPHFAQVSNVLIDLAEKAETYIYKKRALTMRTWQHTIKAMTEIKEPLIVLCRKKDMPASAPIDPPIIAQSHNVFSEILRLFLLDLDLSIPKATKLITFTIVR